MPNFDVSLELHVDMNRVETNYVQSTSNALFVVVAWTEVQTRNMNSYGSLTERGDHVMG